MNADDVTRVLKLRSQLVRNPYGADTVAAWAESLADVAEHDAICAVRALAAEGVASIAIPEIRQWLRLEQRRRDSLEQAKPTRFDCACTGTTLCDTHRRIGLDNIARIRQQRGTHQHTLEESA